MSQSAISPGTPCSFESDAAAPGSAGTPRTVPGYTLSAPFAALEYQFPCSESTEVRKYLGNMKFTREEMHGKISDLSNGSIAKLFLTKFVHDKCNVLLLDEPTRNVSPLSNPVIREELNNFNGCIISITHDRKFLESVATSVYELTCTGLKRIK